MGPLSFYIKGATLAFALCFLFLPLAAEPAYEISYLLVRSADGAVLAEHQPDKLRTPASSLKAVTAAAALEGLGPEREFFTTLVSDGALERGRLKGDLGLKGEADPELTTAALKTLVDQLASQGVRVIEGDLVVDPGPFSFPVYGPGWAWDDAGQDYSPEITGLSVNGGLMKLDRGSLPSWVSQTERSGVRLIPGREGVEVGRELPDEIAIPRVALRTGQALAVLLEQQGVRLQGGVRIGTARGEALATHRSRKLREILKRALEVSDNLAMELVFRACQEQRPKCLEAEELRIVDGSGLSRYNLISARQLTKVLSENPSLKPLLVRPGEGTLKTRFLDGWAANNVLAKTGSMSNVSALTGFLFPDSDKECVFAILINGHVGSSSDRKELEDRLVEEWARSIGFPYVLK